MVKVQFKSMVMLGARRYAAGQVAVFSRWVAAALVQRGVAEYAATDTRPTPRGVAVTESRAKVHAGRPMSAGPVELATAREINKSAKDTLLVYVARLGGTVDEPVTLTNLRKLAAQLTAAERDKRDALAAERAIGEDVDGD